MEVEGEQRERYSVKCAVPECQTVLWEGDWYYALGGQGQVKTCVPCATQRTLRFMVGRNERVEPRGWDKLPGWMTKKLYIQLQRPDEKC